MRRRIEAIKVTGRPPVQQQIIKSMFGLGAKDWPKDLDLDEKKYAPRAIHANISRAKNELIDVDEYQKLGHTYYDDEKGQCESSLHCSSFPDQTVNCHSHSYLPVVGKFGGLGSGCHRRRMKRA